MAGLACCKKGNTENFFPETLRDFGYEFKDGKMRNIETGEGFQFVVKEGDQSYNQRHYEALGEIVTEEVYNLLKMECGLQQLPVPCDADPSEPSTFVFASEDALTNPEKLLVLIHGSGVVRAGQWARRLIINDTLDSGTQIPFIKEAQKDGYGILVMNTNDNYRRGQHTRSKIRGSETPECHALYVWEQYIYPARAKHIAIIAHSYGGCVTTSLFKNTRQEFTSRVFCVAMTDSVHFLSNPPAYKDLVKVSRNWVCSQQPLDTPVSTQQGDIKRVSAGVTVHEQTSWSSFPSVFRFLRERLAMVEKGQDSTTDTDEGDLDAEEGRPGAAAAAAATPAGGRGDIAGDHAMSDSDEDGQVVDDGANSKKMKMTK